MRNFRFDARPSILNGFFGAIACLFLACSGEMTSETGPDLGMNPPIGDPLRACMMSTLPRLTVVGNELRIRCGAYTVRTRLKGINRSGLQHKNGLQMAGFGSDSMPELKAWRDTWKTVVVRLAIAQTYYLYYDTYRQDIANVVAATRALGMYLVLELHGYDANNLNSAQPDPNSTPGFWGQVAQAFGGESHVLFDIWNEPHSVPWSTWKTNAEKIITAIRGAGANDTLIVVGGLDYAYDLSPLVDPANRITGLGPIIYATHPYPLKSMPASMAAEWDVKFGLIADIVPVIVGEYGVDDSSTVPYGLGTKSAAHDWMIKLHEYIDAKKLSALAWSAGDAPQLTYGTSGAGSGVTLPSNPPDPNRPTDPFGIDVKAWMLQPIM
jgi:hypothetical protein